MNLESGRALVEAVVIDEAIAAEEFSGAPSNSHRLPMRAAKRRSSG
jgi:hypothetical protein